MKHNFNFYEMKAGILSLGKSQRTLLQKGKLEILALTKNEMKAIKGGVYCSVDVYYSNGDSFSNNGYCGSSDVWTCKQYAQSYCAGLGGGTVCGYNCS